MTENTSIAVIAGESTLAQVINENYPAEVKESFKQILSDIMAEKTVTEMYPEAASKVIIGQSLFQDIFGQYNQFYTPYRKLRQVILEMNKTYGALYAAKTGHKKAEIKKQRILVEIDQLQEKLKYTEDEHERKLIQLDILEKEAELEEIERDLRSSSHLIKDALFTASLQKKLIEKFQKECDKSPYTPEEEEVIHYILKYTEEAENQLRNGRIDSSLLSSISKLPEPVRVRILHNINLLQSIFNDIKEGKYPDPGHITVIFKDKFIPQKSEDGKLDGLDVNELLEGLNLTINKDEVVNDK